MLIHPPIFLIFHFAMKIYKSHIKPPLLKILGYQIISISNKDIQKEVVSKASALIIVGLVDYSWWWKALMELDLDGGMSQSHTGRSKYEVLVGNCGHGNHHNPPYIYIWNNDESWKCLCWLEINISELPSQHIYPFMPYKQKKQTMIFYQTKLLTIPCIPANFKNISYHTLHLIPFQLNRTSPHFFQVHTFAGHEIGTRGTL